MSLIPLASLPSKRLPAPPRPHTQGHNPRRVREGLSLVLSRSREKSSQCRAVSFLGDPHHSYRGQDKPMDRNYAQTFLKRRILTILFSKLFGFFICNIPLCFQICFISYKDYHLQQDKTQVSNLTGPTKGK